MLVLNRQQVEALLDLDQLIDALAAAMAELSAGRVSMPPRIAARVPEAEGLLAVMPAYLPASGALAAKLVSVFPHNASSGLPTHLAVVAVFDPRAGACVALLDGTYLTAARTAAGSALATRLLARPDADVLAIVGTGVQARMHGRVVPRVRRFREIRVVGRDAQKMAALAEDLSRELGVPAKPFATFAAAASGAGVICAATHCTEPVVIGRWLGSGVHVNSVGFNPQGRELDDEAIRKSLIVVESRASALASFPAGSNDLVQPIERGIITADRVHAEVGEIVSGTKPGRTSRDQITLYKSVGVAVEDAVAAGLALAAARERGAGLEVEL